MVKEKKIGKVTHYFDTIGVAIVKLSGKLKVGDKIHIKGNTTDFEQKVESMQVNHKNVVSAKPKDDIGLKVIDKTRANDTIFLA